MQVKQEAHSLHFPYNFGRCSTENPGTPVYMDLPAQYRPAPRPGPAASQDLLAGDKGLHPILSPVPIPLPNRMASLPEALPRCFPVFHSSLEDSLYSLPHRFLHRILLSPSLLSGR